MTARSTLPAGLDLVQLGRDVDELRSDPDRAGEWVTRANCRGLDPDLFFPERGDPTREAKAVCQGCRVRSDCLAVALARSEKFGIWGGMSERERRRIRRALAHSRRRRGAA